VVSERLRDWNNFWGATCLYQVHLRKGFIIAWFLNVKDRDNVFMIEIAEQFHLPQSPETKHRMIEWGDFLDSDFLAGRLVKRRACMKSAQYVEL